MRPFTIPWTDEHVARVLARVRETKLPLAPTGVGWALGCDADFMRRLQHFWANDYDWRAAARDLNRYPQYIVEIDGRAMHVVRVEGENPGKRPLLLTHGWPGSHYEFWGVIERLAFPSRFGGDFSDAFDLVIPSLPGFGYSAKPLDVIGPRRTADMWNDLMTRVLGFPRYLAQGGDWGALVTTWLGTDHADHVAAIHLNMLFVDTFASPQTGEEKAWLQLFNQRQTLLGGYSRLQTRKPQSLAWASADNPLGQASWIIERFHDWTDVGNRSLDTIFSFEHLITNAMIYIMPDSFPSAAWYYHGFVKEAQVSKASGNVLVPTAYSAFPGDNVMPVPPRSLAKRRYPINRWTDMPRGGHFAAMQEPALFAEDVLAWGREAWPA